MFCTLAEVNAPDTRPRHWKSEDLSIQWKLCAVHWVLLTPEKFAAVNHMSKPAFFKESGYDVKIFDKVFNDLKIKKPKGY